MTYYVIMRNKKANTVMAFEANTKTKNGAIRQTEFAVAYLFAETNDEDWELIEIRTEAPKDITILVNDNLKDAIAEEASKRICAFSNDNDIDILATREKAKKIINDTWELITEHSAEEVERIIHGIN